VICARLSDFIPAFGDIHRNPSRLVPAQQSCFCPFWSRTVKQALSAEPGTCRRTRYPTEVGRLSRPSALNIGQCWLFTIAAESGCGLTCGW
jgi:hypothetical protein